MERSSLKEYFTNATAQTLGRALSMGSVFLVFVMVARFIGTEQFGKYAYLMVFWTSLVTVAEFGTNSVIAKDLAQQQDNGPAYFGNFLILRASLILIAMAMAMPVAWFIRKELFAYLLAGIVMLPFLGSRFFEPVFQIYGRPWYSLWLSSSYSLIYLFLSTVALLWKPELTTIISAYIAANIIYVFIAFFLTSKVIKPLLKADPKIIRSILKIAIPIGISGILTLVHMRADTFMLAAMKGDIEVGLYNAAYKFLDMAVILAVMISNPLMPILSKYALGDREVLRRNFSRITELISVVIIPVAVITPFVSKPLMGLCFGQEFIYSSSALNIMAWIGVMTFYSMLNYTVLVAVEVVFFQIWLTALSAVMNVGLNLILIPPYGFIGSAWATLATEIVLAGVSLIYVNRSLGNIISLKNLAVIVSSNILLFLFLVSGFLNDIISLPIGIAIYIGLMSKIGLLPLSIPAIKKTVRL